VIDEKKNDRGTAKIAAGAFEAALRDELGNWVGKAETILFSGMVTSRNGWIESPFVPTPARPGDLAAQALTHHLPGLPPLVFLPGIAQSNPLPDVMRGEEMSLFGVEDATGVFILPGPHAKWVTMDGGGITCITTYMSGEVLNLLRRDSLVSRLIPPTYVESVSAFRRGVLAAYDDSLPGRVLARIFSARSLVLFDRMAADDIADYLEGLLIGAEIAEATTGPMPRGLTIVGSGMIADRYQLALELRGLASSVQSSSSAKGFGRVMRALQDPK
jgi:2-dehydro-3-deoxygalactonokinase